MTQNKKSTNSFLLDDVPPGRWQVRVEPFGAMGEVMVE